jgi:hypothetical protein
MAGYGVERIRQRRASSTDKLAGVLLVLALLAATVYALRPINRGGWRLVQANNAIQEIERLAGGPESKEQVAAIEEALDTALGHQREGFQDFDQSTHYARIRAAVSERIDRMAAILRPSITPARSAPKETGEGAPKTPDAKP